jgi:hypothetical protein
MNNPMLGHIKSMSLRKLSGMGGNETSFRMLPADKLNRLEQKLNKL